MNQPYVITLDGGKYTVINNNGLLHFERYREPWPAADDLKHSGVVLAMAQRIEELECVIRGVVRGSKIAENCYADDGMVSFDADSTVPFKDWEAQLRNVLEQKP